MKVHPQQASDHEAPRRKRFVLVTGPSGAGRSSALKVLEDAGFETIDNPPLRLLPALIDTALADRPMALGIDVRNRDFSSDGVIELLNRLAGIKDTQAELLFLDCAEEILIRRFSETRRRHPLAPQDRPAEGIRREREILRSLRRRADVLIDTSQLNVHQLRSEVEHWFAPSGEHHLTVSVQSFSYKRGLPRSVDMVHDCRFLRNPYWETELRPLNGMDPAVSGFIATDPRFEPFTQKILDLSLLILPASKEEGKSHFSIAFGCTGGQHRSVALAEHHALRLAEEGWQVSIRHRELDRQKLNEATR